MENSQPKQHPPSRVLPYVFTIAYSIIFVQALIIGFDRGGMSGAFVASASAFTPLGIIAGATWRPVLLPLAIVAAIPAWVFLSYLYGLAALFTTTFQGMPLILEPLSVSVFYFLGAWSGKSIANFFKRRKLSEGLQ